jgi:hypothetical protein
MSERRTFCAKIIPNDCRQLLFFVQDGEQSGWIGFRDREGYLREGLGLDPEMVELALRGLELTDPNSITPLHRAVALAEKYQQADADDRANQRPSGRPSETVYNNDERTQLRPAGNSQAAALRRLRKYRLDIHARVLAGELTPHAGMIEAGFRKRREFSRLERAKRLIATMTEPERHALLAEMSATCPHCGHQFTRRARAAP